MPTAVRSSEARTHPRDSQPGGSSSWPLSQRISSWSAATSARSRVASSSRLDEPLVHRRPPPPR